MNTKHTPGPWAVIPRDKDQMQIRITDKYDTLVCAKFGGEIGVYLRRDNPNHCETANARLIAAAPDLLEALEGLLANAPAPKGIKNDYSYILYREAAKTAIAKAKRGDK